LNLIPPPDTDDIKVLKEWCDDLYKFLQFPTFHQIKIIQRSDAPDEAIGGVIYYDSDDEKLKCHNDTDWQDTY